MAGITYLHTGGDLNRRSGGGHTFKLCAIFSHTLELLLAFPYDWENETILPDALRHFKRYQTCMVTFCTYYIAWILGDEGRGENGDCSRSVVRTVSTGCETPQCAASWMLLLYARDSSRWLLTPSPQFLSRGAQTFWHRARAYSFSLWHCLGHSQGSLQCHFSRCKAGSFKELRVRIVLVDAFTDLMRCRK